MCAISAGTLHIIIVHPTLPGYIYMVNQCAMYLLSLTLHIKRPFLEQK